MVHIFNAYKRDIAACAKHFQCSKHMIFDRLNEYDIQKSKPKLIYNLNHQEVIDKYEELQSVKKCADYFGCSTSPIENILNIYDAIHHKIPYTLNVS